MTNFKRISAQSAAEFEFTFDGVTIQARSGDTVLSALLASRQANAVLIASKAFRPWCLMGTCYGCQVMLNGRLVQACMISAAQGLVIVSAPSADELEGQNND